MAASESLRFDLIANDRVSEAFARVGRATSELGAKMDGAAVKSALLDDALKRQAETARRSSDATLALAKSDAILAEVEGRLRDGALEAEFALKREAEAKKKSAEASRKAAAENAGLAASITKVADSMKKGGGPAWLGPALALAPLGTALGGVAAGAALGLGGAAVAGGGALAAFGAVAKPVLADALKAAQQVQTAQDNYNIAIANGTKQAVAYKAEQIAIGKAYAELSPAQIALSKQLGDMSSAWQNLKAAETPVVAGALQPWLKSVTDLTGKLAPVISAVSPYIRDLGTQFDRLVRSDAFTQFRDFVAGAGSAVVGAVGSTLIDFVKAFIILLPQFDPLIAGATRGISELGPAVLKWAASQKTADGIQKFMAWFSTNGPAVGQLLKNIGGALKALAPGLGPASTAEIGVISQFFALIGKLPPSVAKPLVEIAGVMLTLNKLGVVKVGVQIVPAAGKALGKLPGVGGTAAGEGGAAAAGEGAAGAAAVSSGTAGALGAAGAAIAGGIVLKLRQDLQNGVTGVMRDLPNWFKVGNFGFITQSASGIANAFTSVFRNQILRGEDIARHDIANVWDGLRHDMSHIWDNMVNGLEIAGLGLWKFLLMGFNDVANRILNLIGGMIHGLASAFGWLPFGVGSSLKKAASSFDSWHSHFNSGINDQINHISAMQRSLEGLHGKTVNVILHAAGNGAIYFNQSTGVGGDVKGGLKFMAAGGRVTGGIPGKDSVLAALMPGELIVPTDMVRAGAVDHLRGRLPGFAAGGLVTSSPAGMGNWMAGVENSFGRTVEDRFAVTLYGNLKAAVKRAAASLAGNISYRPGAGVAQWRGVVDQALRMEGLNAGLDSRVLAQMQSESGGNPNAINLWDINAQRGDPSRGLMQVIGSTFRAYHWPGTSWNIFNPLANIAAAINYARHVYGPGLMANGMGIGSMRGYDQGGYLPPGLTLAYNGTGRPEPVGAMAAGGDTYNITINAPSGNATEIGRTIAHYLASFKKSGGVVYKPAGF